MAVKIKSRQIETKTFSAELVQLTIVWWLNCLQIHSTSSFLVLFSISQKLASRLTAKLTLKLNFLAQRRRRVKLRKFKLKINSTSRVALWKKGESRPHLNGSVNWLPARKKAPERVEIAFEWTSSKVLSRCIKERFIELTRCERECRFDRYDTGGVLMSFMVHEIAQNRVNWFFFHSLTKRNLALRRKIISFHVTAKNAKDEENFINKTLFLRESKFMNLKNNFSYLRQRWRLLGRGD